MKIISEVVDSPLYTAVFAVKTPALDHSGISHLAEHMVFRGSNKYPANHELFVINTLLPANVNASTQNGVTFYFVSSKDNSLFLLLLDYLYAGLIQVDYSPSEFALERDGVLRQELKMYEKQADYARFSAALRGDNSPENVSHYGGFSDTMAQNTIEDLYRYKRCFYQEEHITLYLKGPEIVNFTPDTLLHNTAIGIATDERASTSEKALPRGNSSVLKNTFSYSQKPNHALPPLVNDDSVKCANAEEQAPNTVITWRIHAAYHAQCSAQLDTINKRLGNTETIIIEDEINNLAHFALRAISERPDTIIPILVDTLKAADIQVSSFGLDAGNHQSEQIKSCMQAYLQRHIKLPPVLPLNTYLSSYQQSYLYPIQASVIAKPLSIAKACESSIGKLAQKQLSLAHIPKLPKLFQSSVQHNSGRFHIVDNDHWLFELSKLNTDKLQSLIVSPEFWSPRLNGECYAMGLGIYDDRLFVYGAQDIDAPAKEPFITKMIASIY